MKMTCIVLSCTGGQQIEPKLNQGAGMRQGQNGNNSSALPWSSSLSLSPPLFLSSFPQIIPQHPLFLLFNFTFHVTPSTSSMVFYLAFCVCTSSTIPFLLFIFCAHPFFPPFPLGFLLPPILPLSPSPSSPLFPPPSLPPSLSPPSLPPPSLPLPSLPPPLSPSSPLLIYISPQQGGPKDKAMFQKDGRDQGDHGDQEDQGDQEETGEAGGLEFPPGGLAARQPNQV